MNNAKKIVQYLSNNQATVKEITEHLGISRQAVHRILNNLVLEGKISKVGEPPKVYYSKANELLNSASITAKAFVIDSKTRKVIDENFLYITPFGTKLTGWAGFTEWCTDRHQDITKMSVLYLHTYNKYANFKKNGHIDGMAKIRSTFADVALDEVFYLDFYSWEIFGKTKLGQLLLFAKQSQDRALMNQMIDGIKPAIVNVIEACKIDGVAYIPPTVKREHQLMKQLQTRLNLDTRVVTLVKIKTPVIVPQKTLTKLGERIINARETIVVSDNGKFNNILLLDDAVGSGATLNEVAKKIRQKGICSGKIIGLSITGSVKGFDVISEI